MKHAATEYTNRPQLMERGKPYAVLYLEYGKPTLIKEFTVTFVGQHAYPNVNGIDTSTGKDVSLSSNLHPIYGETARDVVNLYKQRLTSKINEYEELKQQAEDLI